MTPAVPVLRPREVVAAFRRAGYKIDHQRGSHIILRRTDPPHRRLSVLNHTEVSRGTLRALVRQAGLTLAEFLELLE